MKKCILHIGGLLVVVTFLVSCVTNNTYMAAVPVIHTRVDTSEDVSFSTFSAHHPFLFFRISVFIWRSCLFPNGKWRTGCLYFAADRRQLQYWGSNRLEEKDEVIVKRESYFLQRILFLQFMLLRLSSFSSIFVENITFRS